ncbi:hypothetical protein PG990_009330 [Apiospora arundinis]
MAKYVFSRTAGASSSIGASPRSDSRPDHRVPALIGPRERTWAVLNDPREMKQASRHGGYRDGQRRSLDTAAHDGWQGTSRRQHEEIPPLPSRPHVGSGGGEKKWFSNFRGLKDGENRKETKSHAFDKSLISHPVSADPAFARALKESQRQIYEPILTEMGLAHEMNREPMKLRPIARAETPDEFPAARPEHPGREHGGPLSSHRPMPITAESMAVHDTAANERHARQSRRRPARDSGESVLSRLSTTAVVDEPYGVVDPRWMPRHIDAMAAGYTGFPDWSSDSSVSAETSDEELESPRTKKRNKRLGRIFTAEDFEKLTEFPEPACFAGEEKKNDDERLSEPAFDAVKDDIESSDDSSDDSSDSGVIEEEDFTIDKEPSDASDTEVDFDRYNYTVGNDDQGLTGEILSQTRQRPPIVVLPPTPPASPRPLPALPPTPGRLYPVDWKAKFEEERNLLKKEKWAFNRIQEIAVPLMVAFEEIVASSTEFQGAHTAMAFPPIVRKILEERDEAMDEADAYVHRSLGLENQLGSLMAEVRDLRDENRILRVDNERLRNVRGGLPIEAEAEARMAMRRRTTAPLGHF